MRSTSRPTGTEISIDSSANSDISAPTASALAPSCSANSDTVTRLPV